MLPELTAAEEMRDIQFLMHSSVKYNLIIVFQLDLLLHEAQCQLWCTLPTQSPLLQETLLKDTGLTFASLNTYEKCSSSTGNGKEWEGVCQSMKQ